MKYFIIKILKFRKNVLIYLKFMKRISLHLQDFFTSSPNIIISLKNFARPLALILFFFNNGNPSLSDKLAIIRFLFLRNLRSLIEHGKTLVP